jgi:hypothetical protein
MGSTIAECIRFAPGYDRGAAPFGVWTVREAYVDPAWLANQDPRHDYAILRLDHQQWHGRWSGVQDVVGANVLGLAPQPGTAVTVDGYAFGINDRPLSCSEPVGRTDGYPSLDCNGLPAGTSGGPWQVYFLWLRALLGAPGDLVPFPGSDGC